MAGFNSTESVIELDVKNGVQTTTNTTTEKTSNNSNNNKSLSQQRSKSKYRSKPYPASILDSKELIRVLKDTYGYDIENDTSCIIKPLHITSFYQMLHRQHYPTLSQFVTNYYQNEIDHQIKTQTQEKQQKTTQSTEQKQFDRNDNNNNNNNKENTSDNKDKTITVDHPDSINNQFSKRPNKNHHDHSMNHNSIPLKNKMSMKKNKNRIQLPKQFLDILQNTTELVTVTSSIIQQQTCHDQSTTKLIIQLHDEQLIESVIMRYKTTTNNNNHKNGGCTNGNSSGRATLCVSSQCGCAMGCTFCATGTMGLSGSLTTGEILEQIVHADRVLAKEWTDVFNKKEKKDDEHDDLKNVIDRKSFLVASSSSSSPAAADTVQVLLPKVDLIRNVVFMGMGEPLDNYQNVVAACKALVDKRRWNLAHGRVTVSTVGIISKIRKLSIELPDINLALSLHAPNQTMRTKIVPTAKQYPIEQLIDALDGHMMAYLRKRRQISNSNSKKEILNISQNDEENNSNSSNIVFTKEERVKESSRRRAMIEYIMLEGETSTLEAAHELGNLCKGKQLVVNLIPYNQTDVEDTLRCPSYEHMETFKHIVSSYGCFCSIRKTMGADIDSACGQLITLLDNDQEGNPATTTTTTKKEQQQQQKHISHSDSKDHDSVLKIPDIEDGTIRNKELIASKSKKDSALHRLDRITTHSNDEVDNLMNDNKDINNTDSNQIIGGSIGFTRKFIEIAAAAVASNKVLFDEGDNRVDQVVHVLTIGASISATCFIISTTFFLLRKR